MDRPKAKIWLTLVLFSVVAGFALFLVAGTLDYWQAWLYLAIGALSSVPAILSITRDPILLEGRSKTGPAAETRTIQKIIVLWCGIAAVAALIVPALDRRFGWSNMPWWLSIVGEMLIIAAMWMVLRVFQENSYGASTVAIAQNQTVISTGPYRIVRNPMYTSAAVYFIGVSLALGSYWGLVAAVLTILGLVWRLLDEEKFLAQNLPGYGEYCARVRWHLIPGVF